MLYFIDTSSIIINRVGFRSVGFGYIYFGLDSGSVVSGYKKFRSDRVGFYCGSVRSVKRVRLFFDSSNDDTFLLSLNNSVLFII